jgi:hypothetical protein
MGKYEPLAARLRDETGETWSATFIEVERTLGFSLPQSARSYREWWANQRGNGHSQTKGWQDAGWRVWKVDLEAERVTFRRASSLAAPAADGETEEKLFERAAELLGTNDRAEIVREALRGLIQREAGRRLMALGGTMPDLKTPSRERPLV